MVFLLCLIPNMIGSGFRASRQQFLKGFEIGDSRKTLRTPNNSDDDDKDQKMMTTTTTTTKGTRKTIARKIQSSTRQQGVSLSRLLSQLVVVLRVLVGVLVVPSI